MDALRTKYGLVWVIASTVALAGLACSLAGRASSGPAGGTPPSAPPSGSMTGSLQGEATSAISVRLTWNPVPGATGYTVNRALADLDPLTVATLAADAVSFEDFPAPPDAQLRYHVQAITSGGPKEVGTASVATPPETPNPLSVTVTYEQNQFVIPTFDPNHPNVDPKTFLPPGLDPNNPDPSLLAPGPKSYRADIGPEGGTLEASGANGVMYKLTVPAGAVPFAIPFALTPVASIDGLPLSGSLIGAVRVDPEGVEFNLPLTLEITPAAGTPALPEGQVGIGFAVTPANEGSEFYFLPSEADSPAASDPGAVGHLARLAEGPRAAGPLGGIRLKVGEGKVVGYDSGPGTQVREFSKDHPPSSSKNRTTSKAAAAEEEELAPLPTGEEPAPWSDREAQAIHNKANAASNADEWIEVLTDFQAYLDAGGRGNEALWSKMLEMIKNMFYIGKAYCFTRDGFTASGVAARMAFADEGTLWSQIRDRYVDQYGEKSLDDALAYAKRCKLTLGIDSKMTWSLATAGTKLTYEVTIKVSPLVMGYESDRKSAKYGPYLKGYALVYPSRVEVKQQGCSEVTLNPFPTEFIRVALKPTFDGEGNLVRFSLVDFGGGGVKATLKQKCGDTSSTAMIAPLGGGMWGGMFVDARSGEVGFDLPSLASPPPTSGEIARRRFSGPVTGISGATIVEDTTFKMTLGQ